MIVTKMGLHKCVALMCMYFEVQVQPAMVTTGNSLATTQCSNMIDNHCIAAGAGRMVSCTQKFFLCFSKSCSAPMSLLTTMSASNHLATHTS